MNRTPLGQLLLQTGAIDAFALGRALSHQRSFGGRIGEVLLRLGLAREEHVVEALGRQLGVSVVHVGERTVPPAILGLAPEPLLRKHHAFPLFVAPKGARPRYELVVAVANPQDVRALDDLAFAAGMPVRPVLAGARDISRAMDRHFGTERPGAPRMAPIELEEDLDLVAPEELGMVLEDVRVAA